MNIEIPEGYKQTEIGIIPNDWNIRDLKTISKVVRGGSPRPAGNPKFFGGSYIPWLTVASLTNIAEFSLYVSQTVGCLTEEGSKYSRTLDNGTLIIANSGATLGVAKILAIRCCANDGIAALIDLDESIDKLFLCYFLNTKTREFREVIAPGNGQPNLNTTLIGLTKVPLPPTIGEQKAIAQALSDVDAAIAELDRFITKNRNIKQGTMQQLLTGKKRLPGFSGEWEENNLGDLAKVIDGDRGTNYPSNDEFFDNGYCLFLNTKNVSKEGFKFVECTFITKEKDNLLSKGKLIRNDLVLTTRGTIGNIVFFDNSVPFDCIRINSGMVILRNETKYLDTTYLYLVLKSNIIQKQIDRIVFGSAQPQLTVKGISLLKIPLPPLSEQKAIAQVLSDMDTEIQALEQKRNKYKAIKQGMMQELLTGRTRLI